MNNYLLFFILIAILFIYLYLNKWDLSIPGALFCVGFVVSSFAFMINTGRWNYVISGYTIFVIVISVLVFMLGSSFSTKIRVSGSNRHFSIFKFKIRKKNLTTIFIILFFLSFIVRILDIYYATGSLDILIGALGIYRFNPKETQFTSIVRLFDATVNSIVIYQIMKLVQKIIKREGKIKSQILFIILGLAYFALSSSRIELIYIFIYFAIAYYAGIKYHGKKINIKAIKTILFIIIGLYFVFFAAGYLTGKSQMQESVFDNISLYTGSSIGALDSWLKNNQSIGNYFGSTIFRGVSNFLSLVGIPLNLPKDPYIRFINLGNMPHTTNVFTCLAELLGDVGMIGMIVVLFLEGAFSGYVYKKAKLMYKQNKSSLFCIYLYLAPLILTSSISERFFRVFFTFSTVVFLLFLNIFNKSDK